MPEDKEIMELYKVEGKKEYAFNLLMRKYEERLYWHIRNMTFDHDDSDDILQNTFIKAWGAMDSFREESGLYTWLYRIATNETLTFLKRKRLLSVFSLTSYSEVLENKVISDSNFDGDELQRRFYRAVAKLPDKQRSVFIMKYFDGLKYEEISEIAGVTVGALKASYHHACAKIKKNIDMSD